MYEKKCNKENDGLLETFLDKLRYVKPKETHALGNLITYVWIEQLSYKYFEKMQKMIQIHVSTINSQP